MPRSLTAPLLEDTLGSREDGYACAEDRVALERLLRFVSPRVRLVLRLRFERDLRRPRSASCSA